MSHCGLYLAAGLQGLLPLLPQKPHFLVIADYQKHSRGDVHVELGCVQLLV